MPRMIFVNLPVKDLAVSREFFTALGFTVDERLSNEKAAGLMIEENIYVMLLTEPFFRTFINDSIVDTGTAREVLLCLSCESRAQVDETLAKAVAAGAKPWQPVIDQGPMYGASFQDPDGHVWELSYLDLAAAGLA